MLFLLLILVSMTTKSYKIKNHHQAMCCKPMVSLPVNMQRNWQNNVIELQSERNGNHKNENNPCLRSLNARCTDQMHALLRETEEQNKKKTTDAKRKGRTNNRLEETK